MAGRKETCADLELRHVRYFLALAEELNFNRAALRLGIAQPGLSQQIKMLEGIVGALLVDRSRRAIKLTLAGELFAEQARKAVAQIEHGLSLARRAARGELGHVAIGYVGSAAYTGILTVLLRRFREVSPEVQLDIREMEMTRQLDEIADGSLDLGFIRPPVELPPGIVTMPVLDEEVCLVLPDTHPCAELSEVPLDGFRDDTFITPRHGPGVSFHHHTVAACGQAGFVPKLGPQGHDFMTIASMVSVGLGVALAPRSLECIQLPGILFRGLKGVRVASELAVAVRLDDPSPAIQAVIRLVRELGMPGQSTDKRHV